MRTKDILEEIHWSLGTLLAEYHVCQHCHQVYMDPNQTAVGMACQECGTANTAGLVGYFDISVWALINLMQEFFHKDHVPQPSSGGDHSEGNSPLAVVIFFATLREVLLKNFLTEIMIAQRLTVGVSDRLFDDNQSQAQMLNNLFPALTGGVKWKQALEQVRSKLTFNPLDLNTFLIEVATARNACLHAGAKWVIRTEMAEQCMLRIEPILQFYVALHNEFVPRIYQKTKDANQASEATLEPAPSAGSSSPQG